MAVSASRFSPVLGDPFSPSEADLPGDWTPSPSPNFEDPASLSDLFVVGAGPFNVKGLDVVFGDALTLESLILAEGVLTTNVDRCSGETFNLMTLLFFVDLLDCEGSAAGGVDMFDKELGTRRSEDDPFAGPGMVRSWTLSVVDARCT